MAAAAVVRWKSDAGERVGIKLTRKLKTTWNPGSKRGFQLYSITVYGTSNGLLIDTSTVIITGLLLGDLR